MADDRLTGHEHTVTVRELCLAQRTLNVNRMTSQEASSDGRV